MSAARAPSVGRESGLLFLALALVYWLLRCPSFGPGDSAQHALSAMVWGVSRPPGYPLYTAVAHAFARLGGVSFVGGFSGLAQAAAAALLFRVCRRQGCGLPAALAATLLLAFSPLYWFYAEVPEVRGLNDALAMGAAAAALDGPDWLLGVLLGLGVAHHPTFLFIVPSLALLNPSRVKDGRRLSAIAAIAAAAGALPYALLWARLRLGAPPIYNPDAVSSASDVLGLFLRRRTGGLFSVAAGGGPGFSAAGFAAQLGWYGRSAAASLTLGLALAVLGGWSLRAKPRLLLAWALWAALPAVIYAAMAAAQLRAVDEKYFYAVAARFHLLPLMGLAVLAALGAQELAARTRERFIWGLAAAAVAGALIRPVDLRAHEPTRRYAQDLLDATKPGDALVLDSDDAIFSLLYADLAEGRGGGRVWLVPPMLSYPPYRAQLARAHPGFTVVGDARGFSHDWSAWAAANKGRAFWAEGSLREVLEKEHAAAYPDGPLIRLAAADPGTPDEGARRFLYSSLGKLARWDLFEETQEVSLERAAVPLAHWHLHRARDPKLHDPLAQRLEELW